MGAEIIPYRNGSFISIKVTVNEMTIAAHIALELSFISMYIVNKRIIIKL